jgi:hypothetical protein
MSDNFATILIDFVDGIPQVISSILESENFIFQSNKDVFFLIKILPLHIYY